MSLQITLFKLSYSIIQLYILNKQQSFKSISNPLNNNYYSKDTKDKINYNSKINENVLYSTYIDYNDMTYFTCTYLSCFSLVRFLRYTPTIQIPECMCVCTFIKIQILFCSNKSFDKESVVVVDVVLFVTEPM